MECEPLESHSTFDSEFDFMVYRFEATSVIGFVQMLASNYLAHGYFFYVTGRVPEGKSPEAIDRKILAKYGIELSPQQRSRRKAQGIANLQYLRFQNLFVIIATHGKHPFFETESNSIRDVRRVPLQFHGYSISVKRGGFLKKGEEGEDGEMAATKDHRNRVHVLIGKEAYKLLEAELLDLAAHRTAEKLKWVFWNQPFEPYAPIRRQLLTLLRAMNNKRAAMGYERLPYSCIRYRRQIVKPFENCVSDFNAAANES